MKLIGPPLTAPLMAIWPFAPALTLIVPPLAASVLLTVTLLPAVKYRPSVPVVEVIGAETRIEPAAFSDSVVLAPAVLASAEATVILPASDPLDPVEMLTLLPALSEALIAAASTVAPLALGVKLPLE